MLYQKRYCARIAINEDFSYNRIFYGEPPYFPMLRFQCIYLNLMFTNTMRKDTQMIEHPAYIFGYWHKHCQFFLRYLMRPY